MLAPHSHHKPHALVTPHACAVLHARAGNCIGDMASYDYFALGGPYSVRGYAPGELGAARRFAELAAEVLSALDEGDSDVERLVGSIRAVVRHAARRPELNRMMVKESSLVGDRLVWLVDTHVRLPFEAHRDRWERLRAEGLVIDVDALHAFYLVLGAATLVYTNAPEARLLTGLEPTEPELVEAHADALVRMIVRTEPTRSRP